MHHLTAFQYVAGGAAFTLQRAAAIPDSQLTFSQAGNPFFPVPVNLRMAYVWGQTDLSDAEITTPKLRPINPPHLRPLDASVYPATRPYTVPYRKYPLSLNANEEISVLLSGATGTNLAVYNAALWLETAYTPAPMGDVYTVRGVATITNVVGGWASGTIALDQILPAGTYSCVGLDGFGTNVALMRLVFAGGMWRPGCICGVTAAYINAPCFRMGELGEFGRFTNTTIPNLEVFALGAGNAQTVFLDLVKVG